MGNTNKKTFTDETHRYYVSLHQNSNEVKNIRNMHTVIDVDYFTTLKPETKIVVEVLPEKQLDPEELKTRRAFDMVDFCFKNELERDYQKIDYVCNEKERLCVCNTHADDFRKIYNGQNYKEGRVLVAWVSKKGDRF